MKLYNLRSVSAGLALAAITVGVVDASALGWPSHYEGVMLQGFYWDSYQDSKWTNLEAQSDELSRYFSLIWIPNSGKCGGHDNMGYMPQYWFTNHNSSFGSEKELLSMIETYRAKGTGFIADCVINHRNGLTNWYDFPTESWNGKTWKIGLEGICGNDEMAYAAGQPKPTGAYDTGENFDGCRDLDHTNSNVQNNCKNYVKCLKEKYGYVGVRYDMVKGYGGQYNKIYNTYANVDFSVGEYWDGQYDAVAGWIEATGKTSAAFDFPCKYAINEAFATGDMRKLVWKANGTTDQPAGLIHFGYPRYAVTFIDNHDTYRDGSKFNGNVEAANAFILLSPGTPCVFLPHYQQHREAIQKLIAVRKACGINNESSVRVLRSSNDCYMAEVTGTKGKAVVKVGSAMVSPDGYSDSDIRTYGNDYCVWSKTAINNDPVVPTLPSDFYMIGHVDGKDWAPDQGVAMKKASDGFTADVELKPPSYNTSDGYAYFSFVKNLAPSWDALNVSGNRFGPSSDMEITPNGAEVSLIESVNPSETKAYKVKEGNYTVTVDWKNKKLSLTKRIQTEVETVGVEETVTYFDLQGNKVAELTPGNIYIRVSGKETRKIMAR